MIEVIIKDYLDGHLDVPSFFEFEDNMPDEFILIERTGGRKENHLKSATVAIQSYSTSLFKASALNEKAKDVLENMIVLDEVSGIYLNSDYNFTDIETKRYRYQAVFEINYY